MKKLVQLYRFQTSSVFCKLTYTQANTLKRLHKYTGARTQGHTYTDIDSRLVSLKQWTFTLILFQPISQGTVQTTNQQKTTFLFQNWKTAWIWLMHMAAAQIWTSPQSAVNTCQGQQVCSTVMAQVCRPSRLCCSTSRASSRWPQTQPAIETHKSARTEVRLLINTFSFFSLFLNGFPPDSQVKMRYGHAVSFLFLVYRDTAFTCMLQMFADPQYMTPNAQSLVFLCVSLPVRTQLQFVCEQ